LSPSHRGLSDAKRKKATKGAISILNNIASLSAENQSSITQDNLQKTTVGRTLGESRLDRYLRRKKMKVTLDPQDPQAPSAQTPATSARTSLDFSASVTSPVKEPTSEGSLIAPVAGAQAPNVTFHRDHNGRIYYVFSDAQSGEELREVPPEAVRNVAEGSDQYLKRQQAKSHTLLNTKG
jgi:hypothetical protein